MIASFPGTMEVEKYLYTPGLHGLKFAEALKQGRILAGRCADGSIYVPPPTFCPDGSEEELVDVTESEWIVDTYTVVYEDMYGNRLEEPQVVAVVRPAEARGGMIHYVKADPEAVYTGMRVKPVFAPEDKRRGLVTDIVYFEPA
jgi:hypothetical protein